MKFSLSLRTRTFGLVDYLFLLAITLVLMLVHPALPDFGYIKRDPFAVAPLFFKMALTSLCFMYLTLWLSDGVVALLKKSRQGASSPPIAFASNTVTLASIEARIVSEAYEILDGGRTTRCTLTLANGWVERGESSCVDPANFNEALGRKYSREQAINKIWPLEGYLLRERLFGAK